MRGSTARFTGLRSRALCPLGCAEANLLFRPVLIGVVDGLNFGIDWLIVVVVEALVLKT